MMLRPSPTPIGAGGDPAAAVVAAKLERDRAQEVLVAACEERDGLRRDVADCDARIAALERLMVAPDFNALSDAGIEHVRQQQQQRDAGRTDEDHPRAGQPQNHHSRAGAGVAAPQDEQEQRHREEPGRRRGGGGGASSRDTSATTDAAETTASVVAEAAETRAVAADVLAEVRRCRAHYRLDRHDGGDDDDTDAEEEDAAAAATVHRMADIVYQLQVLRAGNGGLRRNLPGSRHGPSAGATTTIVMDAGRVAGDDDMSVSAASEAAATPPRSQPRHQPRHHGPADSHAAVAGVSDAGLGDDTPPPRNDGIRTGGAAPTPTESCGASSSGPGWAGASDVRVDAAELAPPRPLDIEADGPAVPPIAAGSLTGSANGGTDTGRRRAAGDL